MAWAPTAPRQFATILIPHKGHVSMEWSVAYRNLQIPPGVGFRAMRHYPIDVARDQLAQGFVEERIPEWSIWVDDDVLPPPDGLMRLLNAPRELLFLSGVYPAKKVEYEIRHPAAWRRVATPEGVMGIQPLSWENHGYTGIELVGMGFVRIHRSVFERLRRPWFYWTLDRYQDGRLVPDGMSEDFYLCWRARNELGITPVVDMDLRCGHVADAVLTEEGKLVLARV